MIEQQLRAARIVPVITFDDAADAVPLASVLYEAGLTLIEVALRSDAALDSIRAIRAAGLPMTVAAGTVRTPHDFSAAAAAGASIAVSPGSTPALLDASRKTPIPWLPGARTPSEVMALSDAGYALQKLFPADLGLLDALAGPFPDVRFVATGGIDAHNLCDFFGRSNVVAVAGSWIVPRALIRARAWRDVGERAAAALAAARTLATTN